jgi:energy-coupling factor transporter ATP-binding protein EcfA2
MYIKSLRVDNLRCFKRATLELRFPGEEPTAGEDLQFRNVNLLIGDNGTGKSTVLKALALATLAPVIRDSGFVPYFLVRLRHTLAKIRSRVLLNEQDIPKSQKARRLGAQSLGATIKKDGDLESIRPRMNRNSQKYWDEMRLEKSAAFFVVGYGATRRVDEPQTYNPTESRKRAIVRYQRIAGLFESHIALVPLSTWLPQITRSNPGRFMQVRHLLNALMPDETEFTGKIDGQDYLFRVGDENVPFSALSDGYRAYVGWVADLLYHINYGCPSGKKLVDNAGLVLVDEIDLHLHPTWQRTIVERVAKALPRMQFVFSTHSPIVAGSLKKENIFVMEENEEGGTIVRQLREQVYGLGTDRILESSYFNVPTTRPNSFVNEIQTMTANTKLKKPEFALSIMGKLSGSEGVKKQDMRKILLRSRRSSIKAR